MPTFSQAVFTRMSESVMQVWKWIERIYPMVTQEYNLKPTKPVVMGECADEHGSEYGFEVASCG